MHTVQRREVYEQAVLRQLDTRLKKNAASCRLSRIVLESHVTVCGAHSHTAIIRTVQRTATQQSEFGQPLQLASGATYRGIAAKIPFGLNEV